VVRHEKGRGQLMGLDIDYRVSKLLDQLEDRNLTDDEINKIKEKIEFLRGLKE
jgi:hypothetical protein